MATSAQRREQLENHLETFREIADHRMTEKIMQWSYHLPAMVSAAIFICQVANTIIFASFAYNFGKLYLLLDEYMRQTDTLNITLPNSTVQFRYAGVNVERINEIDNYHDQLWNLFIAEVIELIFPAINLFMFAWIIKDKKRRFPTKIQMIYLLCPALALILSITQALTIHVSITESIYTIRFLLAKVLGILLEVNRQGRYPIEQFFECEFFNDDDIVKPPCAGQIHDTVLSKSTLTVVITIHIIPIIICVYLLIRNLKSHKLEHLFLYIESVPPLQTTAGCGAENGEGGKLKVLSTNNGPLENVMVVGGNGTVGGGGAKHANQQQQHHRHHFHLHHHHKIANGMLNTNNTNTSNNSHDGPTLRETLNNLLVGFNVKFVPKKVFCEHLPKFKEHHLHHQHQNTKQEHDDSNNISSTAQQEQRQQVTTARKAAANKFEEERPETSL